MSTDNVIAGVICAGLAISYACLTISIALMCWVDYKETKEKIEK